MRGRIVYDCCNLIGSTNILTEVTESLFLPVKRARREGLPMETAKGRYHNNYYDHNRHDCG